MTTPPTPPTLPSEGPKYLRPLPPSPEDLVILAGDDVFYLLKKEAYLDDAHLLREDMGGQARLLVEQGVTLADIPVGSLPGVGAMCYLVNLSGFKPRKPTYGDRLPPPGRWPIVPEPIAPESDCLRRVAPAMDDLIIHDREGTDFYWVKKCEYERPEARLDRLEPILGQQVRLLTNQGVVIADIPGGEKLWGVDDMGVLVNLKRLPHLPPKRPEGAGAPRE